LHDDSLAPEDRVKVWINLAVAYRDLGDTGNARQAYDHAMQLRAEQ
jgi:cytochrome c-type biogenesis protein CcmH/NrfG